ncbi:hypothetical protein [Undibacterium sp. Ren11W]|uniref:hypothetical protein n=1 Tax=Undibacterium sp. Ren11W TaxID=3413045 RepID=UPI003BF0DAD1
MTILVTQAKAAGGIRQLSYLSLISTLFLTGCGVGSDVARDISDAIVCSVSNCKDSGSLKPEDIRASYLVTQNLGTVRVEASLSQSANLLTVVSLSAGDHLSTNIGSQSAILIDTDGHGRKYAANLADASPQPSVNVNFYRGTDAYVSNVTMPKPFSIVAPSGTVALGRLAGKLYVRLDVASNDAVTASTKMHCQRVDGTLFDASAAVNAVYDAAAPGGAAYRVDTLLLDQALNVASKAIGAPNNSNLSLVQNCDLELIWTLSQSGQSSTAMSKYSSITAQRSVSHLVTYDARN